MTKETRLVSWGLMALGASLPVPFGIHWMNARLAFALGLQAGADSATDTIYFRQSFVAGFLAFGLILTFAAWRAKVRLSGLALYGIGVVVFAGSFLCSYVVPFGLGFADESTTSNYFDGFVKRVAASGIESNAVAWVDQLAGKPDLNTNGSDIVELPPDKVPAFFAPVFGKMGPPMAIICFDRNGKVPDYVDIHVGLAAVVRPVQYGISVVQDADESVAHLPGIFEGRSCGKRLMAYWGGD
jgi:hypothetical protein